MLSHLQKLVLHASPDTPQIDGVHPVKRLRRLVRHIGSWSLDARIVEGGVKPAKGSDGALHHRRHLSFVDTSQSTPIASPPADLISSTAFCKASSLTSAKVTAAPAWAKARAVASPIPEAAPVTSATGP